MVSIVPAITLAIDASEWFHDPALRQHVSVRHWRRLPARAEFAVRATLDALVGDRVKVTWFVTGALAQRAPELLRQLVAAGHEVALAALAPCPLHEVRPADREQVRRGWMRELQAIEAATGIAVVGFRAVWPVQSKERWWLDWLEACGFVYDASPRLDAAGADAVVENPVAVTDGRDWGVGMRPFTAWWLDGLRPRLTGLPRHVFAEHYGRIEGAQERLVAALPRSFRTIGESLASGPHPARPRVLPPPDAGPPPKQRAPRLTIVVPLKDEESGIASLAGELAVVARDLADVAGCEFVLVDDGSTDHTWGLLQQHFAGRSDCTIVQHLHNRGIAAAIQTGMRATDAELVASIDGDLSYDPLELRAMLALATDADVVTASPYHPRGGVRNVPGWRLWLSRTLSAAYRCLLCSPVRTWTSCFRLYRRAVVVDLPLANDGFLGTAELLVRVLRRGGRVAEHPCVLEARLFGVSKLRVLRTIRGHLGLLWQVLWRRIR